MFLAKVNLKIGKKEIKAGEVFKDKPAKWLIEQGLVEKIDKKYQENKLQMISKQEEE